MREREREGTRGGGRDLVSGGKRQECDNSHFLTGLDINECVDNNGGCSDDCINLKGSFKCQCPFGKKLASDKKTCVGKYRNNYVYILLNN